MLSLEKKPMLDLQKQVQITLEKKNLTQLVANLVGVFDDSGSMSQLYSNGQVQNIAERILALASKWDPDQKVDVLKLNGNPYVGSMAISTFDGWISRNIRANGGTEFAPAIREIIKRFGNQQVTKPAGFFGKLFGKPNQTTTGPLSVPTFVFFLTDGENADHAETERALIEASHHGIFFQFVGIGNEDFRFLQKLDNLRGRLLDNANFFKVPTTGITDEQLYDQLLNEFPSWITQARVNGLIN